MIDQASATGQVPVTQRAKQQQKPPQPPPKVSATLEPEDVSDLRAYCKEDGIYMPDHSTFAAALLRAELKSMGCTGCRQCGGNKARTGRGFVLKDPEAPKRVKRRGFRQRKATAPKKKAEPTQARLYKLALRDYRKREAKRNGWMIATTPRQRDLLRQRGNDSFTHREVAFFFPELPPLNLRLCTNCKGVGTIPRKSKARSTIPLTARPTGSSKQPAEGGGAEMNEEALHRRGKTDRRLAEVRRRLNPTRRPSALMDCEKGVLETYYQPGNETLRSLWQFTRYGRILLDTPNPNGLTDRARITALLDAVHQSQDKTKQGYIDQADTEAQKLLDLHVTTWNAIVAELVAVSSKDKNGAPLEVGAVVLTFEDGVRRRGRIEAQEREFWRIRCPRSNAFSEHGSLHKVMGQHLERVA